MPKAGASGSPRGGNIQAGAHAGPASTGHLHHHLAKDSPVGDRDHLLLRLDEPTPCQGPQRRPCGGVVLTLRPETLLNRGVVGREIPIHRECEPTPSRSRTRALTVRTRPLRSALGALILLEDHPQVCALPVVEGGPGFRGLRRRRAGRGDCGSRTLAAATVVAGLFGARQCEHPGIHHRSHRDAINMRENGLYTVPRIRRCPGSWQLSSPPSRAWGARWERRLDLEGEHTWQPLRPRSTLRSCGDLSGGRSPDRSA